jgi:hypothetical protein
MGEIAAQAVIGTQETPPNEAKVRLWHAGNPKLRKELEELGFTPEEVDRHERFKRSISPKLKETLFKLGD